MARKNHTDEFRRQAVDRSTPGATLRGIAADLGISRHTLNDWIHAQTATAATAGDATDAPAPAGRRGPAGRAGRGRGRGLSPEEELAALRALGGTFMSRASRDPGDSHSRALRIS